MTESNSPTGSLTRLRDREALRELVERAVGVPSDPKKRYDGVIVMLADHIPVRTVQRLGCSMTDDGLTLFVWPGSLQDQARLLYGTNAIAGLLSFLESSEWRGRPEPNVAYRLSSPAMRWYLTPSLSLEQYAHVWSDSPHMAGVHPSATLRNELVPWLLEREIAAADDLSGIADFEHRVAGSVEPNEVDVRPSIEVSRSWPAHDAVRMHDDGTLVAEIRREVNDVLQALGEAPLRVAMDLASAAEPTADVQLLDQRVAQIRRRGDVQRPPGQHKPGTVAEERTAYVRDPRVKAWVLEQAGGACELCGEDGPFLRNGEPFLEVHHVRPLAQGGSDTVENAAALCPDCHRACHLADDAEHRTEELYVTVDRLVEE